MRALATLSSLMLLAGCAAPSTAYSVAPPDAVAQEAYQQEQMINAGKHQRYQSHAAPSFSTRYPLDQRVLAVTERILIAAAPYCGQHVIPAYAVSVGTTGYDQPTVINSGGALRQGDIVTSINGQAVPGGKRGWLMLNQVGGQAAHNQQPVTLTAQRGRQQVTAQYPVVAACGFGVALDNNNQWNAYADGDTVHIESRLASDVTNDDDLGFVVAHELAHNILSHVGKSQQNMMAGAAAGLAVEAIIAGLGGGQMSGEMARMGAGMGGMSYSQEFEREADYVGMYLLANSGYDLEAGPRIARRIAEQDPRAIRYASSHPSSADRAASLMATIREIQQKLQSGAPLVPNAAQKRS